MMAFIVTERAMRPASPDHACFYCKQPIGMEHKSTCVLIHKKVRVRLTIEYEVEVPADWDAHMIEFQRNEGSWCADNLIRELETLAEARGCLCSLDPPPAFEMIADSDTHYLSEG